MTADADEIERRRNIALKSIHEVFGTSEDEYGATLFVSHHLEEIGSEYWQEHCGTARPEPKQVLSLLTLRSHWGEDEEDEDEDDEGIDTFDFSLPGNVTDYVISVRFDENGEVTEISMES